MTRHVPDDLLQAFVNGETTEQVAVDIAEHVDECPACATRAASLEPLAAVFATVRDPIPPADLVDRILRRLEEPEPAPGHELMIGAVLLAGAALLANLLGSPLSFAADLGVVLDACGALGRGLATGLASSQLAVVIATLATLAGGLLTLHYGPLGPSSSPLRRLT